MAYASEQAVSVLQRVLSAASWRGVNVDEGEAAEDVAETVDDGDWEDKPEDSCPVSDFDVGDVE